MPTLNTLPSRSIRLNSTFGSVIKTGLELGIFTSDRLTEPAVINLLASLVDEANPVSYNKIGEVIIPPLNSEVLIACTSITLGNFFSLKILSNSFSALIAASML